MRDIIDFFSLEIRPCLFADRIETELEIRINTNSEQYTYRTTLQPEHFTSLYDRLFDVAKHKLKEEILKNKQKT